MTNPSRWRKRLRVAVACAALCSAAPLARPLVAQGQVLRLATTTSTADTGLLAAILPAFEKQHACRVDVVAVGTGQALELGRRGDADVVLVHALAQEKQFVADGHARERFDVMYNDFVVLGPTGDPARISGLASAQDAFAAIAKARAPFASRGDRSGTHTAELSFWSALKIAPAGAPWYRSLGQGMGETLTVAEQLGAYVLSDRGTYLAMRTRLPHLKVLVGGARLSENPDPALRNRYGVMAANPGTHPGVRFDLAMKFVTWLLSVETQRIIGEFGVSAFGQPLYYPDSEPYRASRREAGRE